MLVAISASCHQQLKATKAAQSHQKLGVQKTALMIVDFYVSYWLHTVMQVLRWKGVSDEWIHKWIDTPSKSSNANQRFDIL